MKPTATSIICLVSISTTRGYKQTKASRSRQKIIERRLHDCFPNIEFIYDSLGGSFDLNQTYGEVITPLATSFGIMDFVELPLADSIWINKLYIDREIDINVHYALNYGKPYESYEPHTTFPSIDKISKYQYPKERQAQFRNALSKIIDEDY